MSIFVGAFVVVAMAATAADRLSVGTKQDTMEAVVHRSLYRYTLFSHENALS